jgi:rhodanese-related sulfurtransferase
VKRWLDSGEAILIDVREPAEHRGRRIEPARLEPFSRFEPARLCENADGDCRIVLHCKSGTRSKQAAEQLARAGLGEVWCLEGGIDAWQAAGLDVVAEGREPLDILRQVQIAVGACVLAGAILAAVHSPWWLILPAFFGAGLLVAGLTGTCGLALILARMPWNQR